MQLALATLRNSNALSRVIDFDRCLLLLQMLLWDNLFQPFHLILYYILWPEFMYLLRHYSLLWLNYCSYLRSICSGQNSMHSMSELSESLNAIDSWVIVPILIFFIKLNNWRVIPNQHFAISWQLWFSSVTWTIVTLVTYADAGYKYWVSF